MEWWLSLLIIFGGFVVLMAIGVPVAFSFTMVNIVAVLVFMGGTASLSQLMLSIFDSVVNFSLLSVPFFLLMGEVLFHSRIGFVALDVMDKWLGRLPGRLALLAVSGGTLFGALSGSSVATSALLGSVLVPEMEKRGYKHPMSLGPVMGSAGLDIMIPPSALAVLLGTLAHIPVGDILGGGVVPGLLMAALFATYIIIRCKLQPHLAPPYEVQNIPLSDKIISTLRLLPMGIIVFLVIGLIFLGVATPTEAAAAGALGCIVVAFLYRAMDLEAINKSIFGTVHITVMMLMILTGSTAFAQVLAYVGATQGLVEVVIGLSVEPIVVLFLMQAVLMIMGCFMEPLSIMMVTLPIFMPVVQQLGFNQVWFAVIMLLNMGMATLSPPFGLVLFAMKGVAPSGTTMGQIYRAAYPFLGLELVAMILMVAFPPIVLWLPGRM